MNEKIIDISTPLNNNAPVWPDSTGVQISWTLRVEKNDPSNLTRLDADIHVGTHVEGGLHSFADGIAVDQIPLECFIGPALVVYFPNDQVISATALESARLSNNTTRVLFKTRNSKLWVSGAQEFQKDFVGLDASAARWLVDHKIQTVGMDYLSVACYTEGRAVHEILLKNNIAIIEGLNLSAVDPGEYKLICLPILLPEREAAPARAILMQIDNYQK